MKAAAAKKLRQQARQAVENEQIVSAPWKAAAVKSKYYHTTNRRRDEDNHQSMLKAAYDGIVDAGLVSDDDSKHMRKEPPEFLVDKKHPRVELFIMRTT